MKTQTAPSAFSTYLAIASFGIGTLLLILYLVFPQMMAIIYAGYFYVKLAILVNGITFLCLCYQFLIHRLKREVIAIRMLILLANIPVALLYLNIVLHSTN